MGELIFYFFRNAIILAGLFIVAGVVFNERTLPFMLHSVASNILYILGAGAVLAVLPYLDGSKKLDFGFVLGDGERTGNVTSSQHGLKSEAPEDRINAAAELGKSGNARAVISLISALSDQYPQVRNAVQTALVTLTKQDFQQDIAAWKQWWRKNRDTFRG